MTDLDLFALLYLTLPLVYLAGAAFAGYLRDSAGYEFSIVLDNPEIVSHVPDAARDVTP